MSKKKEIRKTFKDEVFKRDNYTCKVCGNGPYKELADRFFDAHHITDRSEMPNGGYVKENGITVCKEPKGLISKDGIDGITDFEIQSSSCHMKCEIFHISSGTEWDKGLHPDDLYIKINSSKSLAIEKSELL